MESTEQLRELDERGAGGRVRGLLAAGEDAATLLGVLRDAPALVARGEAQVLGILDSKSAPGRAEAERKRETVVAGRAERYAFVCETSAGPRVMKVCEVRKAGNALLALVGSSVARREHAAHAQAQAFGVAASRSLGFLEWRRGPVLVRACQVQTLVDPALPRWDHFLADELTVHGDAALEPAAEALARLHARQFFHADLKGYHGYVVDLEGGAGPRRYGLRFIDLARIGFRLSRRRRVINLYQALRFIVPPRREAHERFMAAYTRASGWYADSPLQALSVVHRFLAYKYVTYPVA